MRLRENNGGSWGSETTGELWDQWGLMRITQTNGDQCGLMRLRDQWRILRLRANTGFMRPMGIHESQRLLDTWVQLGLMRLSLVATNGDSGDSEWPMENHETHSDYWRLMRPMGTHETQRPKGTHENQRDYWIHESNRNSWDSERLMETNGDSGDSEWPIGNH